MCCSSRKKEQLVLGFSFKVPLTSYVMLDKSLTEAFPFVRWEDPNLTTSPVLPTSKHLLTQFVSVYVKLHAK